MRKEQVRKNPRGASMTTKQDHNILKSLELSEGQLEVHFRRLNLAHMRRIYQEVAVRAEKESWSYRDFLALLLAEEVTRRKQTRLQRCTRSAHFPFFKTIDEFDFTLQSTLRESVIGSYLGLDFVTEGRSLILHGKTGRGKTHLAVAIGYRAIQNGFEALFTTAAELIEDLSNASKKGHLQESLETYTHPHVLVIDEVGYLTYGPDAANVLFHVVNNRHLRKRPMIFTTNKPLNEWGKVLHDEDMAAAILDRVLERGRFIHLDGPSGRTRHLNLQEILPASADRARISGIDVPEFPEPTKADNKEERLVRHLLDSWKFRKFWRSFSAPENYREYVSCDEPWLLALLREIQLKNGLSGWLPRRVAMLKTYLDFVLDRKKFATFWKRAEEYEEFAKKVAAYRKDHEQKLLEAGLLPANEKETEWLNRVLQTVLEKDLARGQVECMRKFEAKLQDRLRADGLEGAMLTRVLGFNPYKECRVIDKNGKTVSLSNLSTVVENLPTTWRRDIQFRAYWIGLKRKGSRFALDTAGPVPYYGQLAKYILPVLLDEKEWYSLRSILRSKETSGDKAS